MASMIAIVAIALLSGCNQKKAEIEKVMRQCKTATIEFTNSVYVLSQSPISTGLSGRAGEVCQRYADQLRAIDISHCPDDFRVVFVKYYQEVGALRVYSDSITGWRGILRGALNPTAVFALPDNTDKATKPTMESWRQLELVCVKYGIK